MEVIFNKIRQYWENQSTLSLQDRYLKTIEIEKIVTLIKPGRSSFGRALEIGCGDGEGTSKYAVYCDQIIALDYSFMMLQKARQKFSERRNVCFIQADIRYLPFKPSVRFDLIISERCLINLPEKSEQDDCIVNLTRHLNPSGRFVFMEGSQQGLDRLNRIRQKVNLNPIPMPWHNLFFNEDVLIPELKESYTLLHKGSFWYYYLGSRVIQPALVYPLEPRHDSDMNRITWQVYQDLEEDFWPYLQEPVTIGQIFFLNLQKKDQ